MSDAAQKTQLGPLRLTMAKGPEPSTITSQKLTRLKVNRIAIVQSLRVEHVLKYLVESGVFTEDEKNEIQSSGTTQAKARKLLDLLPQRSSNVDWYGHFRFALKNPEVRSNEVKKKYQILIEFLDNTIIQAPPRIERKTAEEKKKKSKPPKLPHYDRLPSIDDSGSEAYSPNKTHPASRVTFNLNSISPDSITEATDSQSTNGGITDTQSENYTVKSPDINEMTPGPVREVSSFSVWNPQNDIKNFSSLIEVSTEHFQELEDSQDPEDQALLEKELEVLEVMKRVEVVYALYLREELNGEIILTEAVESLLSDDSIYHLYFKYLNFFKEKYRMHIMKDISVSYCKYMSLNQGVMAWPLVRIGFYLAEFLISYGQYSAVDAVLMVLISHLAQNPELDNWMGIFDCLVKIMEINNTNVNFQRADWANSGAETMGHKIKMMSFGQDILDETGHMIEMSRLMQERGSIKPAFALAQKALREVEPSNKVAVIEALCNACRTLVLNHSAKRAQPVAVEVVRQARLHFGSHHPLYIKALLCFCHYCSEFHHKEISIEAAEVALRTALKVYNSQSVVVAEAHQALAIALMTTQQFDDETYFTHALEAWRCVIDVIEGGHPSVAPFKFTLSMALYWRSLYGKPDESHANILWAESEAKSALSMFEVSWGQFSLKAARTYVLLGLIYFRMKRYEDSENTLLTALTLYKLCTPPHSNYTMFAKSVYAIVLKVLGKMQKTIIVAKEVIEETDCGGVHLTWVKTTYDLLVDVLEATGSHKEAEVYRNKSMSWLKLHPPNTESVTWNDLNERAGSYEDFMKKYDIWQEKAKTIKKGIKSILQSKK